MKITIYSDEKVSETEITISCNHLTPEIEKILSILRMMNQQLTGIQGEEIFLIDVNQILYFDTVDKKTFFYTDTEIYETPLKLYELETQLSNDGFFRSSKSCIINLKRIRSLRSELNRRIKITMENGEQLIVSRQYAESLKERLGVT